MNILFVCDFGRNRSRTAAELLEGQYNTDYAGILSNIITKEQADWANRICVMEKHQAEFIKRKFPQSQDKIIILNIPNMFSYNDPVLTELLKEKIKDIQK